MNRVLMCGIVAVMALCVANIIHGVSVLATPTVPATTRPSMPGYSLVTETIDPSGRITMVFDPVAGPVTVPATKPTTDPTTVPITGPTTQPQSVSYTVSASEVLAVRSTTGQPRLWTLAVPGVSHSTQDGFNASWCLPISTQADTYQLTESNLDGSGAKVQGIKVLMDPYTTYNLSSGADIAGAIKSHPDHSRFALSAGQYIVTSSIAVNGRVQIVAANALRTTVVMQPPAAADPSQPWQSLYCFYLAPGSSASLGLQGLTFTSRTGAGGDMLNSLHKTGCSVCFQGSSCWANLVIFSRVDTGIQCDAKSSVTLLQDSNWSDKSICGVGIWLASGCNVQGCTGGPSTQEHCLRASLGTNNVVPQFVRVADNTFDASHPSASTLNPGKESMAFRDGKYFYVARNRAIGWSECGQDAVTSPDQFSDYVFTANTIADPPNALHTGTLHARAGCTGPGVVSQNKFVIPAVVTARVPPVMRNNDPD
jgi:hypothetical protein